MRPTIDTRRGVLTLYLNEPLRQSAEIGALLLGSKPTAILGEWFRGQAEALREHVIDGGLIRSWRWPTCGSAQKSLDRWAIMYPGEAGLLRVVPVGARWMVVGPDQDE